MAIISFSFILLATVIYSLRLENIPMRALIRLSLVALFINSCLNISLALGYRFGLTMFEFVGI
jgi:hypothetical protein